MKVIIDIPDDKQGRTFLKRAKALSYVQTAKKVSASEIVILKEISEIKKAHRLADQVRSGKLKGRPARELLNEL